MCRRCGEPDRRPNAADRRAQKRWLLTTFGNGDGSTCPCFWCQTPLSFATVQRDRIVPGGPYRRENLVPSCGPCNIARTGAHIPDGCEYGPVGDLTADHNDRHPSPFSRKLVAAPARLGLPDRRRPAPDPAQIGTSSAATSPASAPEERPDMRIPRPQQAAPQHAPAPEHTSRPGGLDLLVRAEHAPDDRGPFTADPQPDPEPDLVVIDTTDLDQLRARHPWLFTTDTDREPDTDANLRRIDAELRQAETTRNTPKRHHADRDSNRDVRREDADERDAGYGR